MYLLDTNVASELGKDDQANPKFLEWIKAVRASELFTSALVLGELRKGIVALERRNPRQASIYQERLARFVALLSGRVLSVDATVAQIWGEMEARHGPLSVIDGLLAATAQAHHMTLVTRNLADVERTGVRLLNPFGD